jgi:hypothetical protein
MKAAAFEIAVEVLVLEVWLIIKLRIIVKRGFWGRVAED